ncbi:maleylacetate reductase [Paenibacillus sp. yr247]|uniref:maleylacetate reductase n=1 Tax=Paenibacillus sp. yr247 TaxID=1761880 RepID=UPI00088FFB23|nr:maleylacetate reductase [Paenibacillus sp. yr247]SDP16876.1 maleylacetate reductase [Paenibacillus sp. yr247]
MNKFQYEVQAARVIFGAGLLTEVSAELKALGAHRALVISTPGQESLAREVAGLLGDLCVEVHAKAIQHVPIETVEESLVLVRDLDVDSLIPIGGGSSIGLAKAIALNTSLPILAIPTTYAGSEMTPIWGITENGHKKTGRNLIVKPKTVIYDPKLTVTLPSRLTVTSGMNAIAHCVEALYAENANPITSLLAEDGIRALSSSLPQVVADPNNLNGRSEALYGCWLGGTVLGSVGMALHHKLCHVLGGSYNLPHAETHTVILPYAIWYNASYAPEAVKAIARAIGSDENNVAGTLFDLAKSLDAPTSLAEIGMNENDLDQAAELATKNPYFNPRPIDIRSIRKLLEFAFIGKRPDQGIDL